MKTVKVRYSVTFQATIQVPDNASPREIGEELANINIPEDDISKYLQDTFEPQVDENGNPRLFVGDEYDF